MAIREHTHCRVCKAKLAHRFLKLGPTPLANSFVREDQLNRPEPSFPLDVFFCGGCGLVQLGHVIPPEVMFTDYIYVSGTSTTIPAHFAGLAKDAAERLGLDRNSLVIDIGGNDGTLLKNFKALNIKVLNVEPASNIAKIAEASGIETVNEFWNKETALKIASEKGKAKLIVGTNVFAHVDDWENFLEGVKAALDDDGVLIIEAPYLVDLLERIEFDTIYHEHLSYLAVRPMATLFTRCGMELFDVRKFSIHGGSIRLYAKKAADNRPVSGTVSEMLSLEKGLKLDSPATYTEFAAKVEALKQNLLAMLNRLKSEGKKIAGYGAPAKGNTLLNYFKIGTDLLDYIVDRNELKQGLYTPGMHVPIFSTKKLAEDKPDYLLILAWNFADEIMMQQAAFSEKGGKFIIPLPQPSIAP